MTSSPPSAYFSVGERIAGTKLRIERVLGRGAQGEVHLVVNEVSLQKQVIKLLHPELVRDDAAMARFVKEVQLMAMLTHPHIVKLLHTDVTSAEGGRPALPYLLMEHLEGESLDALLRRADGVMRWRTAVRLFAEIAEALAYSASKVGFVHRDVKPANLFVARDADKVFAKVLDFGISQLCEALTSVTSDDFLGTEHYAAPEQYSGRTSPKTDVYQLGIVVWEIFAGRHPFRDKTTRRSLMYAQLELVPPALATVVDGCPRSLSKLVEGMVDKDPKRRPTMDAVAGTLRELVGDTALSGGTIACGRRAPWEHDGAEDDPAEVPHRQPTRRIEPPAPPPRLTPAPLQASDAFAATLPAEEPIAHRGSVTPMAATKRVVDARPQAPPARATTGPVAGERASVAVVGRDVEGANTETHAGEDDALADDDLHARPENSSALPLRGSLKGARPTYTWRFWVTMLVTTVTILLIGLPLGFWLLGVFDYRPEAPGTPAAPSSSTGPRLPGVASAKP